ncbi:MAG TPA: RHS repeat-associated core domain-containing protein [Thermoanaerobaculia bacterium]|jgi:RHS repeat-associated protein|nr:RHS repeat-associated core domain-containing protein [Thermoanaerobaculia bacterium]
MKTIAHVLLAAVIISGLLALPLHAEEQVQRYIVVLKQRSGAVPDVASLGGKIEFRQDDQLVVTIPPGALATLKADPKIRYVERVGGPPSDDEAPLIGVPSDPRPGPSTQTARFTPHALGSLAWDSGPYAYDGAGNIVSIGTDNYLYDGVQRLHQSSTQGTPETYTYDGFGNMQTRTNTIIPRVQASTNRYDGYGYNEVGAATSDGSYVFSYDALGQPLSKIYNNDNSKLEYYIYTPGDERIGVQRGSWWIWSVRDEGGKVLRQYKSSSTNPTAPALWLEDFVRRDGLLLGSQRPVEVGGRRHFHLDHLGSPRLITADNGQMVSYHDYYPFGDEHSPVSQEVADGFDREDPMKFTGHERDYAGGMGGEDGHAIDDMHARYYNSTFGRFMSVDPSLDASYAIHNPQIWNRYSYVRNSPIDNTDPDGRLDAQQIISAVGSAMLLSSPMFLMSSYNDAAVDAILPPPPPPPPPKTDAIQPTYAEFAILAPLVPEGTSARTEVNIAERANEIQNALPVATRRFTTTAVARVANADGSTGIMAATNENAFRPAQRPALLSGETQFPVLVMQKPP